MPAVAERRAAQAGGDRERESAQAWRRGAHVAAVCDGGRAHRGSQDAREGAGRGGLRGDRRATVAPVRREVEAFRFSSVRLDLRQGSGSYNAAVDELREARGGDEGSAVACAMRSRGRARESDPGVTTPGGDRDGGDVHARARAAREHRPQGVRERHHQQHRVGCAMC